jgi:2-C-methyl-D-erythritol 4-phosphate cytidylyltransferase
MVFAIIVAAGKGVRMNDSLPKQFLSLAGVPILVHTLRVFDTCDVINTVIVVVSKEDRDFCRREILKTSNLQKNVRLVIGGPQRQDSVHNGLQTVDRDDGIIVIHDGVRPFVRQEHLMACINGAKENGACILGIPTFDTVKSVNASGGIIKTQERDRLWLAQTPQAFQTRLIKTAHENAKKEGFIGTDDASLVERLGRRVKIITGSRSNIKITNPEDLELARAILQVWTN